MLSNGQVIRSSLRLTDGVSSYRLIIGNIPQPNILNKKRPILKGKYTTQG